MPLSVYESPLMSSYRRFKKYKKDSNFDGYYIVHKQRIKKKEIKSKEDETVNQWMKRIQVKDSPEVMFLYGRGPVFTYQDEFTDRFEGIYD
jgi:hypothetical protein